MTKLPVKSTAKPWKQAPSPAQKYRDRKRITLPDGSKRDVAGYGRTKQAATEDLYRKIEILVARHAAPQTLTVRQLIAKWLHHKRMQGRKRSSISSYAQVARLHILPSIGDKAITEVNLEHSQAIQYSLTAAGKHRTAELVTVVLSSAYKHAMKLYRAQIRAGDLQLFDPTEDLEPVNRPPPSRDKDVIWTPAQLERFLSLAEEEYKRGSSLYYPLFYTAISAGLRRGELLGLRRKHVQREKRQRNGQQVWVHSIRVETQFVYSAGELYEDTPKTHQADRTVIIPQATYDLLQEHFQHVDQLVERGTMPKQDLAFPSLTGEVINPSNLRRSYLQLIDRAGAKPVKLKATTTRRQRWETPDGRIFNVHTRHGLSNAALDTAAFAWFDASVNAWRVTLEEPEGYIELPVIRLHTLRKVFGTYLTRRLVQAGVFPPKILQQALGHSRIDISMDIYNLVMDEDTEHAVVDLEALLASNAEPKTRRKAMPLDIPSDKSSSKEDEASEETPS